MSHFSYSSCCSIEEHISNLEDVYAGCLKDNMDHDTLSEIRKHIKRLRKKNSYNKLAKAFKKNHNRNSILGEVKKERLIPVIESFTNDYSGSVHNV